MEIKLNKDMEELENSEEIFFLWLINQPCFPSLFFKSWKYYMAVIKMQTIQKCLN